MTPKEIIEKFFADTPGPVEGKTYPVPLPADLAEWRCYMTDGGHVVLCLVEGEFDENDPDLWKSLCPVPVKAVLRNHRIVNGFPAAPLNYSEDIGLIVDPADEEF